MVIGYLVSNCTAVLERYESIDDPLSPIRALEIGMLHMLGFPIRVSGNCAIHNERVRFAREVFGSPVFAEVVRKFAEHHRDCVNGNLRSWDMVRTTQEYGYIGLEEVGRLPAVSALYKHAFQTPEHLKPSLISYPRSEIACLDYSKLIYASEFRQRDLVATQ